MEKDETVEATDSEIEKTFTQSELDAILKTRLARERATRERDGAAQAKRSHSAEAARAGGREEEADKRIKELVAAERRLELATVKEKLTELFLKSGGRGDSLQVALTTLLSDPETKFTVNDEGELEARYPAIDRPMVDVTPEDYVKNLLIDNPGLVSPGSPAPNQDTLDAQKELNDLLVKGKELREMGRTSTRADLNRMRSLAIKVFGHEGDIPEADRYDEPVQRSESEVSKVHSMLLERGLTEEEVERIEKRGPRAIAKALGF
ncbi:MAG: hypothetical protein JRJ78_14730 [Deltaproteobacteria bacterium]|nr:hypothetical protein [Deltaproteobacteria bacterium]